MTAPTTSLGWTVAQAVATAIDAGTTYPVYAVWPGDKLAKPVMVWGDGWTSTYEIPTAKAGRVHRDETIEHSVKAVVSGQRTLTTAMPIAMGLVAVVETVFASTPGLGLEGVTLAELDGYDLETFETPDGGVLIGLTFTCVIRCRLT